MPVKEFLNGFRMYSSSISVRLFLATLGCFAILQPVQAQQAELSFAGGGQLSRSNLDGASGKPSFGGLLTLKSGIVFGSKWGIGLYYERADLQAKVTRPYPLGTYSYNANVANPQNSFGMELYRKVTLSNNTYLRFGALLGYAQASVLAPTQPGGRAKTSGASLAGGLDASFVFPLLNHLSGIAGTGLRISHLDYKTHPERQQRITTVGAPITLGLNYTFGAR
jgi:hypothetical protein